MNERDQNALCVQAGDVIQLDPTHRWGPVLCIVNRAREWGVECSAFVPPGQDGVWSFAPLRVEHNAYDVIGQAKWLPVWALQDVPPETPH